MTNEAIQEKPQPTGMIRWVVLVFISLAMFGNYYLYDSIAPIADMLKSDLGFTDENIGWMYSIYSVVAVVVLLAGGVFYWILETTAEKKYTIGDAGETDKFVFKDLFKFSRSFWFIVALCVTFYSASWPCSIQLDDWSC